MPFIKSLCPKCSKVAESEREFELPGKTVLRLKCGHLIEKQQLNRSCPEQLISLDGRRLYPFQCDGVRFAEQSSGRALIADEMGLGKTVQFLGLMAMHPEMHPFLCVVKSSLKAQWQHEIMRWMGEDTFAQVINGARDAILPGFPAYIVSYDLLRRLSTSRKEKADLGIDIGEDTEFLRATETNKSKAKGQLVELIEKLKIKTIVLDECQQIKNPESQRTIFVREICKNVPYVFGLSGTPIKNNASEYFPILNILKPEMYPRYSSFLQNECQSYFTGYGYKTGGLAYPERFLAKTKSFIIRRERKEVLPDLPAISRNFQFCDLSKEVEQAYKDTFLAFRDKYNSMGSGDDIGSSFEESSNILAFLSKMRHLVGLSKIDPCIDYVMELMGSTEDRVCIFTHHKDVAQILVDKLNKVFDQLNIPHCARHEAGSQGLETEKNFEKTRVLVCSTLAGGEGLNLQRLCFRFVMLERQWNPANEEQAEARFPRPEGIKVDSIDGTYFVAVGTVDEFFSELVERKREIVNKTLGGKAVEWDQSSLMKELSEVLATSGGRKWSI